MKHYLGIFLLIFFFNTLSAQEKHFVFIQSDTKLPFYVSVNGKLYSSTATGYLIVPKLAGGSYNFTVGFAQNAFPEQVFTTVVQDKDLGFELKNLGEKGWALFNLQSMEMAMATTANTNVVAKALSETSNAKPPDVISFDKKKAAPAEKKEAIPDSTGGEPIASAEPPKQSAVVDSTIEVDKKPVAAAASTTESVPKNAASTAKQSGDVKKVSEVSNQDGVRLSFVDGTGKNTDTIQVVIPSSTPDAKTPSNSSSATSPGSSKGTSDPTAVSNTGSANATKDEVKFLDINMNGKKDSAATAPLTSESVKVMENSNCKNIATEDDYTKLRKKMAMETTDDKMISEARKVYRNKCFTTSQIKGLSTLFLSDEGRLRFFDASFLSVADASQYYTLQSEFIDPAFVNRFKSLLQ